MKKILTLALETGVGGGSVSIFEDGALLDSFGSDQNVSRSEELLADISTLLKRNKIDKRQINRIAISSGPGSFTGLRIGFGVAYGLSDGFGIECRAISLLQAMSFAQRATKKTLTGFLYSKNQVCWQTFENGVVAAEPKISSENEFIAEMSTADYQEIVINRELNQFLHDKHRIFLANATTVQNLSIAIGKAIINNFGSDNDKIYYISKFV